MKIIKESILENYTSPPPGGRKSITTWLGTTMLGALIAFGGGTAHAAAPPAGTNIGNQALATFIDGANIRQETKSNNVLTIVSQVGSLTLTNDNTKVAAVGNIVYMPHVLTNTGNATDSVPSRSCQWAWRCRYWVSRKRSRCTRSGAREASVVRSSCRHSKYDSTI